MTFPDNHDDASFADDMTRHKNADRPTETDKTEKPIDVSNLDFLRAVFREAQTSVYFVGFKGNPSTVKQGNWSGRALPCDDLIEDLIPTPDENSYFTLASYHAGDDGMVRRRKANFEALHSIMLDDIGTKVPFEAIGLPPSSGPI